MSSSIHVTEMHQLSRPAQLIDVRSGSEFASGHIPGAVNIPMDQIEARLDDLRPGVPIVLICQTGRRARMTAAVDRLEGRQRTAALAFTVDANWLFLSAFVGLGLTFAGLTNICPMAEILAKMPWNGRSQCKVPNVNAEPSNDT